MNKEALVIRPANTMEYWLRHANGGDLENLRTWKNQHKRAFFHQTDITPEQQKKWYENFAARDNDFMFMVVDARPRPKDVGVIGFRDLGDKVDIYNVMRGAPREGDGVTIAEAMVLALNYMAARFQKPITCLVLKDNPASDWYAKCGFFVEEVRDDCFLLKVDEAKIGHRDFLVLHRAARDGESNIMQTTSEEK
jgi:hypothetical protein